MQASPYPPITDIKIVSQKDRCPAKYFMITKTVQGHDGQLFDSTWRHKGKRYLCFSREVGQNVIEDITIIGEDDNVVSGFTAITKAHDDDDKALRKHLLCLKIQSRNNAVNAVYDIVLINKNKGETVPPGFLFISNEVNNLSFCYKVAPIFRAQPTPAKAGQTHMPSSAPTGQQWYGQLPTPAGPWQQPQQQAPYSSHSLINLGKPRASSAIEGLPFEVNSKFEILWKKSGPTLPNMQSLSVSDINSKYDYNFSIEQGVTSR